MAEMNTPQGLIVGLIPDEYLKDAENAEAEKPVKKTRKTKTEE